MKKLTLILIGIFIDCNGFSQTDSTIVIFEKDSKVIGFDMSEYSRFTPNYSDYTEIDSIVAKYVFINSKEQTIDKKSITNYSEYYKQIYGLVNLEGDKILFINCFYDSNIHNDWKNRTVNIKGGGRDYFSLKINLNDHVISDFGVNAPK